MLISFLPFYLSESEDFGEKALATAFSGFASPFSALGVCVSHFVRFIGPIFIHIYQECTDPLATLTETKLSFAGRARNGERFFFHFQKRGGQSFSGLLAASFMVPAFASQPMRSGNTTKNIPFF